MASTIAYIDCSTGMSALALLGTLLDAASDGSDDFSLAALSSVLRSLPIPAYQLQQEVELVHEIRSTRVTLLPPDAEELSPRPYAELAAILLNSTLARPVRARALAIFRCLGEAQAHISRHELASLTYLPQVLVEIVCVSLGLQALNIQQIYASPLPLTNGLVEKPEGPQPVPAPVVLEILRRVQAPWKMSPLEGDVVTPIGAAVLATCAQFVVPEMTIERVGYGVSSRSLNLRLCLGQAQVSSNSTSSEQIADIDWVTVIESHIDNMSGELLGGLMERLFEVGALDVTYTPIQMKKNRPASLLTVISPVESGEQLALLLLRETSTLGVRIQQVQRRKAQREQRRIETPFGPMLVKIKRVGTQIISIAPEYDECQRIAKDQQMSLAEVYEVAHDAIKSAKI